MAKVPFLGEQCFVLTKSDWASPARKYSYVSCSSLIPGCRITWNCGTHAARVQSVLGWEMLLLRSLLKACWFGVGSFWPWSVFCSWRQGRGVRGWGEDRLLIWTAMVRSVNRFGEYLVYGRIELPQKVQWWCSQNPASRAGLFWTAFCFFEVGLA